MKKLFVIGIGTGNPEHLSMQAIAALNTTDVIFIPTKGEEKSALAAVRTGDTLVVSKLDRLARSVPDVRRGYRFASPTFGSNYTSDLSF